MTWSDFYLTCFLIGFGLSALALVVGTAHVHLPHLGVHHGIHMPQAGSGATVPWFNFGSVAGFLAWFGGTGYLLEHYYGVWVVTALAFSTISGLAAASIVFWFLAKVLMAREAALDPADYEMAGVLGRISIPIRTGGTGEIIYSQEGTRRVCGARAEEAIAIPKGAEVLVTRYEKGIAYVRPWVDPADEWESKV